MSIEQRLAVYGLPKCPWCGQVKRVFVKAGDEMVCTNCSLLALSLETHENARTTTD
jgi:transcription elongation factor Elf1